MRELKFRAWCKKSKQWLWITGFETSETSRSDSCTLDGLFHDGDFVGNEDIVVVQCTGLKDKNGMEIYEGDILRFSVFDGLVNVSGRYEVYHSEGSFRLNKNHPVSDYIKNGEVEIIGNIYENLDLLQ